MTPQSTLFPLSAILLAAAVLPVSPLRAADPAPAGILREMERVADWQLAHPSKHPITDWTQAPFFLGLFNLYQVSGDEKHLDALKKFGEAAHWGPGPRVTHADDHAVLQAWLEVYELDGDKAKLAPAIAQFDKIRKALAGKPPKSLSGGTFTWCWCDALFMSPAIWTHLSKITDDPKSLDWADHEWWTTTDILYDPQHCLFYRDNRFFDKRTPSGRKVFWSRGNGWVAGGTVHVLDRLPADHPSRTKYLGLYHDMMHALLKLQNPDGLWRTSLLDPEGPVGESSGTSFFVYAMAWGVNRGLLSAESFRPAVMKGWKALCKNIQADGMLGFVQKIGDQPGAAGAKSTEVYGSGAFLLAGSEIVRMLDPTKRRKGLAGFKGVSLPPRYLREKPRVVARFVPERKDDFAWENDLVAFRTYGPALRASTEDSGFDCWLKRVPYPILDKWYFEQRTRTKHSNKIKSYHDDQGEGCDGYKVGDTRGCGGISVWADGKLHNSNTFVARRLLESTPDRAVFELDYESKLGAKTVRETKRITVLMGQRLFQCESRFTIDGKPGAIDVAIGLKPQTDDTKSFFRPKWGTMALWGKLEGNLGHLGQGIAVNPGRVTRMITHTDANGQTRPLCLARTDESGYIRWFAGFAWGGQGEITTAKQWHTYLARFAYKFLEKPFADNSGTLKVHP